MTSVPIEQPVVYIAGDVHLIDDSGPFLIWLDRLALRSPAHLVLLGDLFEYWIDTEEAARRYQGVFQRLRALRQAGWRVDLLRGNREMVAWHRLDAAAGHVLHWPSIDVQLGPRRLRVVHGDRLCGDVGSRFLAAFLGGFWLRYYQASHPEWIQDQVARWIRRRSAAKQRKRQHYRHPHLHPRWLKGAAQGVDTLVAGHIHLQRRFALSGVDLILVGDWPPSGGHWVEGFADGRLELRATSDERY